ncbi:FHIPEP family type III secretion protein [Curtobacterium sp. Csp1]|uniref:flagellar biosynthesis protein FlhA n=1 Tax=unclassified Curtobacterium TaxID=257496 RepID=UPI000E0AF681|nr:MULTISPECIES: flagellar biosynthesis protein FlhA [unclassified Curtobacterium]QKS14294.1 FHIPEP family type III secretion protein [Curtobacterium sp. csp3]QKS21429.1 FHIPEP family type III secretion protein [Curtobacterium sp. Csp1]RDH96167.1 flagellar biosynthesis protein FlhA [Curtobacterium sp. AG1037]
MNRKDLPKLAVPVFIVGIVLLLILPVPSFLLDVLIICNILLALVILLTTLFVKKPLDFSVFPSLLLVATLFRLGLNVASTRLVLGEGFAGDVIQAFGHVAVSGSVIIGAVVFLILVVIQFVVVTKGAERVAEVGARFTLDAMPGKQMAIDADLNAGLITDAEAKERRAAVSAEADFYGAMDGASKFVKGDAIAGILIIVINLIGGIAIGMLQNGLSITDALSKYGILTIGDGLVTQIPALLMAVSTGMIVTRSGAETEIGASATKQLTQSRNALMIAGVAAIAMGFIPGMPILPFLLIGAGLLFAGWRLARQAKREEQAAEQQQALEAAAPTSDSPEDLLEQMRVHALEILLAPDLVDMVSGASDDLLGRVRALRRKIAVDMGIVVPPVRTRDSIDLPPATYAIRIAGVEAGRGTAPARSVLALGDQLDGLPGAVTVEPVFGLAGKWVPAELRHAAEMTGATVIDRVSVLVTHLQAVIGDNAARLLTREDVKVLTEGVKQVNPAAVEELVPGMLSLAEVQRVLQGLLSERVPINDLGRICEALTLRAKVSTDPEGLVEAARAALGPALPARYAEDGTLRVIMIDPLLEQSMLEGLRPSEQGTQIVLDAHRIEQVLGSLRDAVRSVEEQGLSAVLVCAPQLRPAVHRMVSAQANGLPVLSYQEATAAGSTIETVGVVRAADPIAA